MERVKREFPLKRIFSIILMRLAKGLPLNKFQKAKLFRLAGVNIEKGDVRVGNVSFDTIHPERISVGRGTAIADGCILVTHIYDVFNMNEHAYHLGEIKIGRNCYIGSNTIITKSVTIGDGAIIGAGSVINKDIPPYTIYAGVPAKFIRNRYNDISEIPTSTDTFKAR